ncbi:MAG: sulfurtransferase TusA family protein, partial [Promethearchaeota archaeon]
LNMNKDDDREINKNLLDLRGKVCPMTFVYTKLELERLKEGDILNVLIDFSPALENIPESCRRQSLAKLIKIEEIQSNRKEWKLVLKKL